MCERGHNPSSQEQRLYWEFIRFDGSLFQVHDCFLIFVDVSLVFSVQISPYVSFSSVCSEQTAGPLPLNQQGKDNWACSHNNMTREECLAL